jgi:deoxyribodipyrimidine photo-lyase
MESIPPSTVVWFRRYLRLSDNPELQGRKFDPGGDYVRTWVPELARLPDRWIHRPWEAPAAALSGAGVTPAMTYPRPIVDHAAARIRAFAALSAVRTHS